MAEQSENSFVSNPKLTGQVEQEEKAYLSETLARIQEEIAQNYRQVEKNKKLLVEARKDMYENTSHSSVDFDKMIEMVQYAVPLQLQTKEYEKTAQKYRQYEKMLQSPYFARFDFYFDEDDAEAIYIGVGNVYRKDSYQCMVYDWRTPIASVYYRNELGQASYEAPSGLITGEVRLKRQYEIKNGQLQYFFDSSVQVMDDILRKALSGNASTKMKTIVETIQREQDMIIRDVSHDLVMVQGVAGSGKTAIALHRVAYLLYQSTTADKAAFTARHVLLLTPNPLFGQYIENVLPELGEEAIATKTFEEIFRNIFRSLKPQNRNEAIEVLMNLNKESKKTRIKNSIIFKTSATYFEILNKFAKYIERHLIHFDDIYIGGKLVADREILKAELLDKRRKNVPLESRLLLMEETILSKWNENRKKRTDELRDIVEEKMDHPFDAGEYANVLWQKETAELVHQIRRFTRLNYLYFYKILFQRQSLFYHLAKGYTLPEDMNSILRSTKNRLAGGQVPYEDAMALLCLKVLCGRVREFADIKQVMIDEVQDYAPIHFEICKRLFPNAKFTMLGDVNQTIEKGENLLFYDNIANIMNKKSSVTMVLNKSFRCSYEISTFSSVLMNNDADVVCVDRHDEPPMLIGCENEEELIKALLLQLQSLSEKRFQSTAILTKSMTQAKQLYQLIHNQFNVTDVTDITIPSFESGELPTGTVLMPIYMAKGLEFDAVLLYETDAENYFTNDDKNLLYIGCTRALHYLALLYHGERSSFLPCSYEEIGR